MATNLKLNNRTPNKNGVVGSANIPDNQVSSNLNLPFGNQQVFDASQSNSSRTNALFDSKFSNLSDFEIAKRMFEGKAGLSNNGFLFNKSRKERLESELSSLQNLLQSTAGNDRRNIEDKIQRLENEITLITNIQRGDLDFNDNLDLQGNNIEDFNPDFQLGEVSFGYNKTINREAADLNGLVGKAPNIAHPAGDFLDGLKGGGGFGNEANDKTIADGLIDSVQFAAKYNN